MSHHTRRTIVEHTRNTFTLNMYILVYNTYQCKLSARHLRHRNRLCRHSICLTANTAHRHRMETRIFCKRLPSAAAPQRWQWRRRWWWWWWWWPERTVCSSAKAQKSTLQKYIYKLHPFYVHIHFFYIPIMNRKKSNTWEKISPLFRHKALLCVYAANKRKFAIAERNIFSMTNVGLLARAQTKTTVAYFRNTFSFINAVLRVVRKNARWRITGVYGIFFAYLPPTL